MSKPWVVINKMTTEIVGRYESEAAACMCPRVIELGIDADLSYRPRSARKTKQFPTGTPRTIS